MAALFTKVLGFSFATALFLASPASGQCGSYGLASGACGGSIALSCSDAPTLGNANFSLNLSGAPGGAAAFLLVDQGSSSYVCGPPTCFGSTCPIRIHVPLPALIVVGPLLTTPGVCTGSASWSIPIPASPALSGATAYAQALVLNPAGGCGYFPAWFDATSGLSVSL
jgi:hypothetical protein